MSFPDDFLWRFRGPRSPSHSIFDRMDAGELWSRYLDRSVSDEEARSLGVTVLTFFRLLDTWDAANPASRTDGKRESKWEEASEPDRLVVDLA